MRGMKVLVVVGLVIALAGLGTATVNAQQICDPTGPFKNWILGTLQSANVIVIAIDNSGSIQEAGRLPTEKYCAKNAVDQLKGKFFAVLEFNSAVTVRQRPTNDIDAVKKAIDAIADTSNNTLMDGAIDKACEFTQPVRPNGALLMLTDGFPTASNRNPADPKAGAKAAAANFKANCSTLAVIGIDLVDPEAIKFLKEEIASPGAFFPNVVIDDFPTLTEWGLIALGVLLAGSLAFMIRRRFSMRPAGA